MYHGIKQLRYPTGYTTNGRHHRNIKQLREEFDVEFAFALLELIKHIEGYNHGELHLLNLHG